MESRYLVGWTEYNQNGSDNGAKTFFSYSWLNFVCDFGWWTYMRGLHESWQFKGNKNLLELYFVCLECVKFSSLCKKIPYQIRKCLRHRIFINYFEVVRVFCCCLHCNTICIHLTHSFDCWVLNITPCILL